MLFRLPTIIIFYAAISAITLKFIYLVQKMKVNEKTSTLCPPISSSGAGTSTISTKYSPSSYRFVCAVIVNRARRCKGKWEVCQWIFFGYLIVRYSCTLEWLEKVGLSSINIVRHDCNEFNLQIAIFISHSRMDKRGSSGALCDFTIR